MRNPNSAAHAPNTLLLASLVNRSVLSERSPGLSRRLACCPYGRLPGRSRLAFNGEFREPQGWYHLGQGHRLYNPVLRRFNRPDRLSPFGKGGLNGYAYCLGDPVNFSDPTGRIPNFNPLAILSLALLDKPGASLFLTTALLVLNLATAFHATPVGLIPIAAYYSGLSGATIGMTGASIQIAGYRKAGQIVSVVGTMFSGLSVSTRAITTIHKIRLNWADYMANARQRILGTFFPWKWRAAAPPPRPVVAPPPSTPMLDMTNRARAIPESIPMADLSATAGSSAVSPATGIQGGIVRASSVRQISLGETTDDVIDITRL